MSDVPQEHADRPELTREAGQALLDAASGLQHHVEREHAVLGLTPATARALHNLDADRPLPARDLAEHLKCDRSNVTALVDKLEQAGLVQRRTDPTDRRVKALVVTPAGRRAKDELDRIFGQCEPVLGHLSDAELAQLSALCRKITQRLDGTER